MESFSPVLGVMKFETEPLSFENWNMLKWLGVSWLQNAGGFAMIGLFLWILHGLINPQYETLPNGKRRNRLINPFMILMGLVALTLYLVSLGLHVILLQKTETQIAEARIDHFMWGRMIGNLELAFEFALAAAGLAAIIGFAGPFFVDLVRMRWGRIYAIAKLSFKEAVRKRVVWVFLGFLVMYLFPARWFFQEKPEDELKNIIDVTTRGMNLLLIFVGLLLTAFSIPTDIKNLTIHTIVTKPVERFEIVLGRFFGYLGLITAALLMMTGVGLLLINLGNISPEAETESMKARQAVYGQGLYFRSKKTADFTGIDVGREDGYRRYIAGHPQTSQRAIWAFTGVPSSFESMEYVPLEFAFDVYRTTKGVEGAGVQVSFELITHNWDSAQKVADPEGKGLEPTALEAFEQETKDLRNVRPSDPNWKKVDEIAAKYGRYVVNNWQIFDYHTSTIPVPTGLFKNAASGNPAAQAPNVPPIRLQVLAKCETPSQFIGVAKYDLYFLKSNGNFSWNYVKGSLGLWLRLVIATALAVTCSTYLAGVLSFLIALFIFMGGFFLDFITEVSRGLNVGGGPFVSMTRLLKNSTSTVELDQTPTVRVLQLLDGVYQWVLRRVMDIIPDVERYGLSDYVAQGFDIGPGFLFINFLMVVAYVLPWLVAAYYLMKAREIAA